MTKRSTKALTALLTVAFTTVGTGAAAQINLDKLIFDNGVINASGQTDSKEPVTFEIYTKGKSPDDTNVAAFGEGSADENGKFEIKAELDKSGDFTLIVHDGEDYKSFDFSYSNYNDRKKFGADIQKLLSEDNSADKIGLMLEKAENKPVMDSLGMDFNYYNNLSDSVKDSICTVIAAEDKTAELTPEKLMNAYNLGLDLAKINAMGKTEVEEVLSEFDYEFEEVKFSEITNNALKESIINNIKGNAPYTSYAEIEKEYKTQNILYIINNAKVANIYDVVTKYSTDLGINENSDYKTYKSNNSSKADLKLVDELSKNPLVIPTELIKALDIANEAAKNSGSGSGSSGSGGGGGGFSSVKGNTQVSDESFTVPTVTESKEEQTVGFSDMENAQWAVEAVNSLASKKVISGYGDSTFRPNQTVTREEFVKMLVVALGLENDKARSSFYDVFDHNWFFPYVSAAFEAGIVKGDNVGCFGTHLEITRQDAAVMAARAMHSVNIPLDAVRGYNGFNDEAQISDYALEDVKEMYMAGKINGSDNGSFNPKAYCTRAEAAKIIYEMVK